VVVTIYPNKIVEMLVIDKDNGMPFDFPLQLSLTLIFQLLLWQTT